MTYEELVDHYRSKKVFIYGKSVVQIVDMQTYIDSGILQTDFFYHTERHHRGTITRAPEADFDKMLNAVAQKKETLEKDILTAVKTLVSQFRKETGAAPRHIDIHTSAVRSDPHKLMDYAVDACTIDLDIHRPRVDKNTRD